MNNLENCYRVQFADYNSQVVYIFATTALEAIEKAKRENPHIASNRVAVRGVAYQEWEHETSQYTIGGSFNA